MFSSKRSQSNRICFRRLSGLTFLSPLQSPTHFLPSILSWESRSPLRKIRREVHPTYSPRSNIIQMTGPNRQVSNGTSRVVVDNNILPRGAFTLVLRVKLKSHISIKDGKALLAEYARWTCNESGVLRCDVLYEVTKRGAPKGPYYDIWTTFENSHAYMEHERTAHAAKLRICLDDPFVKDTATLLTKLARDVSLLRPLRPLPAGWRSSLQHDTGNSPKSAARAILPSLTDTLNQTFGTPQPAETDEQQRQALNRLIANVGLEDVKILIATATALSSDAMRFIRKFCESYLEEMEESAGIVRTGLLVDRNDPCKIVLMSVHDADDADGASFDLELAADFLDDDGWFVTRYFGVFPDKIGWERYIDEEEAVRMGFVAPAPGVHLPPSPLEKDSSALAPKNANPPGPRYRLLYGTSAFENLKMYIRELADMPEQEVRVMFVSGWNESRLAPLLQQLEYNRNVEPSPIRYKFGVNVSNCMITTQSIRLGIEALHEFGAHIVLAYGGGTVIDMAKILTRLALCKKTQLDELLGAIDDAIERDAAQVILKVPHHPFRVMLLPTALGPGVEMTDTSIVGGTTINGIWRHIPVYFDESAARSTLQPTLKTVLIDSRLCAPRRFSPLYAGQAAVYNTCVAIDVALSSHKSDSNVSARTLALQAAGLCYNSILRALREPHHSSGEARDALTKACMSLGIAADTVGHIGVSIRITLAIVDAIFRERLSFTFRHAMVRVTIAIMTRLCADDMADVANESLHEISRAMNVNGKQDIPRMLLRRADDSNILLLPRVGLSNRLIPQIADRVSTHLSQVECNAIEKKFHNSQLIQQVLSSACAQEYEL